MLLILLSIDLSTRRCENYTMSVYLNKQQRYNNLLNYSGIDMLIPPLLFKLQARIIKFCRHSLTMIEAQQ